MQNNMLRVIHGLLRIVQCVNMQRLREKIKMMSVNQMAVYHTIMEVYNIIPQNKFKKASSTLFKTLFQKKCKQLHKGSKKA